MQYCIICAFLQKRLAHCAEHRNRARMEFFVEIHALLHFMNVFTAMQVMLDCIVRLKQVK